MMFHVLLRRSGPAWEDGVPLREQAGFDEHARFTDALVDAGVIVLGGPLADAERVVLAVQASNEEEVRAILAADPWSGNKVVVEEVIGWTILLDARQDVEGPTP